MLRAVAPPWGGTAPRAGERPVGVAPAARSDARRGRGDNPAGGRLSDALAALVAPLALALTLMAIANPAWAQAIHQGVASCAGSTCHGRQAADGAVVRQNELVTWQDPSSQAGAHSRAWRTLQGAWAQRIADRLGLGRASAAPACLGCHTDPVPASRRGVRFQVSDGVGCEACHGGSGDWLASHYTTAGTRQSNLARGMKALDDPRVLASTCLDCHFGGEGPNQFVSHRMMSAGHPRLTFELDLFNTYQSHHDVDADYAARKRVSSGVTVWAVGQALALERSLTLFSRADRGQEGIFPEFYFFDCHSCHRAISDDPNPLVRFQTNPGRPIASGAPPFNDENMILLAAAARVASPDLAARFSADSRAFHAALATDRASAVAAAGVLLGTTRTLAAAMGGRAFGRADTLDILRTVLSDALTPRYTDYSGGVQAVMAVDTLLSAMVANGDLSVGVVARMRPDIEAAYAAVREPNAYHPDQFRAAMRRIEAALERAT